jgi:hypothetical protein
MSAELRQRLFAIFQSGSAEELAAVLRLLLLLSTRNSKEPTRLASSPAPGLKELKCTPRLSHTEEPRN